MQNLSIKQGVVGRERKWPRECAHVSPILVERVERGYGARCLVCGMVGPLRDSTEEARNALQAASQ